MMAAPAPERPLASKPALGMRICTVLQGVGPEGLSLEELRAHLGADLDDVQRQVRILSNQDLVHQNRQGVRWVGGEKADPQPHLGERLRAARLGRGLSQRQAAVEIGWTGENHKVRVCQIELGTGRVRADLAADVEAWLARPAPIPPLERIEADTATTLEIPAAAGPALEVDPTVPPPATLPTEGYIGSAGGVAVYERPEPCRCSEYATCPTCIGAPRPAPPPPLVAPFASHPIRSACFDGTCIDHDPTETAPIEPLAGAPVDPHAVHDGDVEGRMLDRLGVPAAPPGEDAGWRRGWLEGRTGARL